MAEARLLRQDFGTWLERNDIDRVLKEQELATSFGPTDSENRVRLGQVLRADVLILFRMSHAGEGDSVRRIDLVVAETNSGLRLLSHSLPQSSDPEADAGKVVDLVVRAMAKYRETIQQIYAVPPFLSRDLGYDNNHLMEVYAEFVERVLLAQHGVLVVETAEANSIAREYELADPVHRPRRPLPVYVWGEYRHDGAGDSQQVTLRLETKRADKVLNSTTRTLTPSKALDYLEQAAIELLERQPSAKADFQPAVEARHLARRSGEFLRLREWQQALTLAELSLLLDPAQVEMRIGAILALHELQQYASAAEYIRNRRRSFCHLKKALASEHADQVSESTIEMVIRITGQVPEEAGLTPEEKRNYEAERDYTLPMAHRFADRGDWSKSRLFLLNALKVMSREQATDEKLAFLSKYQHVMDNAFKWQIVRALYVPPKSATVRFWQTILAWDDVDATLKQMVLTRQRYSREALARGEERLEEQRRWKASPPAPPAKSSSLTFRVIEISGETNGKKWTNPGPFFDCEPLDDGSDVFWTGTKTAYHVSASGTARGVWAPTHKNGKLTWYSAIGDGQYLWIVSCNSRMKQYWLDVVEPSSGQRWSIAEEQGLPKLVSLPETGNVITNDLKVTPLGHGEVIAAGYFGDAWLAHIRLDREGNHRVNVFHEAKEVFTYEANHPLGDDYDNSFRNTHIAFRPSWMTTWSDPESKQRTVIVSRVIPNVPFREAHYYAVKDHPVLINPDDLGVSAMSRTWPQRCRADWMPREQVYIGLGSDGRPNLMYHARPDEEPELLLPNVTYGYLLLDGDTLHIVGDEWQWANLKDGSLRSLGETPWARSEMLSKADKPVKREFTLYKLYRSNLYGLVGILGKGPNPRRMVQILFDGSGMPFEELSANW